MKCCMVSRFPPQKCGIGEYADTVCKELYNKGVSIDKITLDKANYHVLSTYDIIHFQFNFDYYKLSGFGLLPLLFKLRKKRIIVTIHETPYGELKYFYCQIYLKILSFFVDKLIVLSDFAKNMLIRGSMVDAKKIEVISIAIHQSMKIYNKEESRKKLDLNSSEKIVLCFGFIAPYKNFEEAVELAAYAKDIKLILSGTTHNKPKHLQYLSGLKKLISDKKATDNIKLQIEYISDEDRNYLISAADVVLFPYKRITQSAVIPNVISLQRPILTSNLEPFNEYQNLGVIETYKLGNIEDMNQKTHSLFNEEKMKKMIDSQKIYAKVNTWEKVAQDHINLYNKLLTVLN